VTTQVNDDPSLLDGPIGFAVNVCAADHSDIDALRQRLPGLLVFARTFYANILEVEFGVSLGGFPQPARDRAARLDADLKRREKEPAARRLIMTRDRVG
jgi:hypothetical protein